MSYRRWNETCWVIAGNTSQRGRTSSWRRRSRCWRRPSGQSGRPGFLIKPDLMSLQRWKKLKIRTQGDQVLCFGGGVLVANLLGFRVQAFEAPKLIELKYNNAGACIFVGLYVPLITILPTVPMVKAKERHQTIMTPFKAPSCISFITNIFTNICQAES